MSGTTLVAFSTLLPYSESERASRHLRASQEALPPHYRVSKAMGAAAALLRRLAVASPYFPTPLLRVMIMRRDAARCLSVLFVASPRASQRRAA